MGMESGHQLPLEGNPLMPIWQGNRLCGRKVKTCKTPNFTILQKLMLPIWRYKIYSVDNCQVRISVAACQVETDPIELCKYLKKWSSFNSAEISLPRQCLWWHTGTGKAQEGCRLGKNNITYCPLWDVAVIFIVLFTNALHRIVAWVLTVKLSQSLLNERSTLV